jgi:predicted glutamine amidotransferase
MCKLALAKMKDGSAYFTVINMLRHQEQTVAGHSTGLSWTGLDGKVHIRKAIGKVNSFLVEYPDIPQSFLTLGHSRYASVGAINIPNQHPVKVMYKGRRIGYAVHNGTWTEYADYEHYADANMDNKTDSQLIFTIYGKILEKYGDSPINRRRALATINKIVKGEYLKSFIVVFDDGQVIASATTLTYDVTPEKVWIMTFGLPNKMQYGYIYEIQGYRMQKYEFMPFTDFTLESKHVKNSTIDASCGVGNKEAGDVRHIEKDEWVVIKSGFKTGEMAGKFGEYIKKKFKVNYRVIYTDSLKFAVYTKQRLFK